VEFEFDENKSRNNKSKHGINFINAQDLWEGPFIEFATKGEYENRFAIIGPLRGKLYTCIYTLRGRRIRIISCRRSREKEEMLYENQTKKT